MPDPDPQLISVRNGKPLRAGGSPNRPLLAASSSQYVRLDDDDSNGAASFKRAKWSLIAGYALAAWAWRCANECTQHWGCMGCMQMLMFKCCQCSTQSCMQQSLRRCMYHIMQLKVAQHIHRTPDRPARCACRSWEFAVALLLIKLYPRSLFMVSVSVFANSSVTRM